MEVRDSQGNPAGKVRELVFDLRNNRVQYVLLHVRGRGLRKYPMHALTLPRARRYLVLDRPAAEVEQAWDNAMPLASSALIGQRFELRGRQASGVVVDVVLDAFWGQVAFAAARTERGLLLRPIQLDALHLRAGTLACSVAAGELEALPAFTLDELAANIEDRDFLQRHARLAHRLTPLR
jgi:hypothetical protein